MAELYSLKDEAAELVTRLSTEISLFFVVGSFLLLLYAYLYRGSHLQLFLLNFEWSVQHGLNVGSILVFLFAFSFTMTVVTPLLLLTGEFMVLLLPWQFGLLLPLPALWLTLGTDVPLFAPFLLALATSPTWKKHPSFLHEKYSTPAGHVSLNQLIDFAYENEKPHLLEQIDRHYAATAARDQLRRLTTGFVVAVAINSVAGYTGRKTLVWQLFTWSSDHGESVQALMWILAILFELLVLGLWAGFTNQTLGLIGSTILHLLSKRE